ncbi:glycosyl hydrolase family 18 [Lachnoclostridium sp. An169]|uniref:glycosyl hydrolase family 18 protein n=1 Tax=Lachnoclostridium sp. An169 TaxID=1965569 RepID=UPI000B3AB34A|nr:glycosyl hydrolase family 18 protein [Lachnoclostridium sp. An169]OUP80623.1 glycosyl hydrolase family 18 [Lachnoclostridium sp. An169]
MDERERRGTGHPRSGSSENAHRRYPDRNTQRSGNRTGPGGKKPRKRSSRARRRRRNTVIRWAILIILILAAVGGFFIWQRYGSSNEEADRGQYYGLEETNDLAVVINNEVIRRKDAEDGSEASPAPGKIYDGQYYIEYSVVRSQINKRFYWDSNENILLYTLPQGNVSVEVGSSDYTEITEAKSADYVILKTEGKTAYIALPFIQEYTNMEYSVYEDPSRAVITSEWGEVQTAELRRDTAVRYQGGVKSPILTEVKKSDKVTVLEDEDSWMKVATADGFVGYVRTGALRGIQTETISREFEEPVYTNISKNYTINMAWHNVSNSDANNYILQTIAGTKGLTTIAPTWFSIADTDGNLTSIADTDYVNYAHQSNLEVWAVLRDFHGGISSYDETYQVLSYTSKRTRLINQVIAAALEAGVDGINLDFELISSDCGVHYIQFVRELSVKCRQNGLVFSVDNYVPQPYNRHYDLEEQGNVADYVMIMGYDEHTDSSYEAGSVASIGYLENGITEALKSVPAEKLVAGVPFYTRLWFETPKTEEELAEEEGTEAASYPNKVSSRALNMDDAAEAVADAGASLQWDDTTKQNYAQWEADGGTYKIWLEDTKSLEEKLKVIKANNLAGVAEWSLGMETSAVWDLIIQYIN